MLEEGLRSPTFSPSEAAEGMLSFIRFELSDGGVNAEKRFVSLFSLLCDRFFGPISGPKDDYRHEIGGWLSRQRPWDQPDARPETSSHRKIATYNPYSDPVVRLLCGMESLRSKEKLPTLIEAISSDVEPRRGVRIQFPFRALPKPTQEAAISLVQASIDGKACDTSACSNAGRLFGELLQVPAKEQVHLRRLASKKTGNEERNRPLSLSPGRFRPRALPSTTNPDPASPNLLLNMIEYFLLTYIRYPTSPPIPAQPAPQGLPGRQKRARRGSASHGDVVYLHLFEAYLHHFLPNGNSRETFLGFSSLRRGPELFLRLVIEFWLCGDVITTPIEKAAAPIIERRERNRALTGGVMPLNLDSAFDLVKARYDPPAEQVQKCLVKLVMHLLKDRHLTSAVKDCEEIRGNAKVGQTIVDLPWCLSPAMTVVQQGFFNFVNATFRHAPIHISGSVFYTAFDTWLLWLEPWNVEFRKTSSSQASEFSRSSQSLGIVDTVNSIAPRKHKGESVVIKRAKPTSRSRYSKVWEPYIAANLHLYTVPLALFIRRARELDFSSKYFSRSFATVRRVFRVFTPEVVETINMLLFGSHSCSRLVETHQSTLGVFSPSRLGQLTLSSLQGEMHALLEEISMQHIKTVRERDVFDRVEASIERFLGSIGLSQAGSGAERDIRALVEEAKLIVSLDPDYEVIPVDSNYIARSRGRDEGFDEQPERLGSGQLTERGRHQVLTGVAKCSPMDVAFLGNESATRIRSHEIPFLVTLLIYASEWLNVKFGLKRKDEDFNITVHSSTSSAHPSRSHELTDATKPKFLIDLRFLADYRNLLFLGIILYASGILS